MSFGKLFKCDAAVVKLFKLTVLRLYLIINAHKILLSLSEDILRGLTRPAVKKKTMNPSWTTERVVIHNRRTWVRELWVCCGIVSPTAEL